MQHASRDFACPEESVHAKEIRNDRFRVRGCGKTGVYECHSGQGCWKEGYRAKVARERAEREFGCPREQIRVRWVQQETYRVEGCDQARVYECDEETCIPEGSGQTDLTVVVAP